MGYNVLRLSGLNRRVFCDDTFRLTIHFRELGDGSLEPGACRLDSGAQSLELLQGGGNIIRFYKMHSMQQIQIEMI